MSAWGEMRRRSAGKQIRKEDLILDTDFKDLYPETISLHPTIQGLSDFVASIEKMKKENNELNKKLKQLKRTIKNLSYECLGRNEAQKCRQTNKERG